MTLYDSFANHSDFHSFLNDSVRINTTHPLQYSTFCKIIQKENTQSKELLGSNPTDKQTFYQNVFKYEFKPFDLDSKRTITKLLLYIFITSFDNPKTKKFHYLGIVQQNCFLDDTIQTLFFNAFCSAQRKYWLLNRLVHRYKRSKMKIRNDTDLYMNPITSEQKDIITLIHENQKYIFTKTDILKLVDSSITHSVSFHADPSPVKNPYNNLPFDPSCLYHIYFFLKKKLLFVPILIHQFFSCGFQLDRFEEENKNLLCETIIQSFLNHPGEIEKKCDFIHDMFCSIDYGNQIITIDEGFPKQKLVDIMKPYLRLFILSMYSTYTEDHIFYERQLKRKLRQFYNFNPKFGRKIISFESRITGLPLSLSKEKNTRKISFSFNDSHIKF